MHINIRIQLFSFPKRNIFWLAIEGKLAMNAHTGLKYFSQVNSFSLLIEKIQQHCSNQQRFKVPQAINQVSDLLLSVQTQYIIPLQQLWTQDHVLPALIPSNDSYNHRTPFKFSFPFSPKYNSDSLKEIQPQTAELS